MIKFPILNFKFSILAFLLLLSFNFALFNTPISAHLAGQPPYLKINGKYTNLYPVPVSSLDTFKLPQDIAPENYLVNQQLNFEMEIDRLPAPPDVVKKTTFTWDFGDGGKGTGLSQTHTYSKAGSYFQIIYADDGSTPTPQLLSSVLINVLPDNNYKLPIAVITVNNLQSKDPLTDVLKFPLSTKLQFSASSSSSESSKIVSYFWDFGDQTSSDKASDTHSYSLEINQVFPVLRIQDANGFIADSYVELENGDPSENSPAVKMQVKNISYTNSANYSTLITIIAIVLVLGSLLAIYWKRRSKK